VGSLIAIMVEEGDDWQNVEIPSDAAPSPAEAIPKGTSHAAQTLTTPKPASSSGPVTVIGHEELHGAG